MSLETRRLSFVQMVRSSLTCLTLYRRPSRLDMYILDPYGRLPDRQHLANQLFRHFTQFARAHGCRHIKAITTPTNFDSIAFHKSLGMQLLGELNSDGIPVVSDYANRGGSRVVFWKSI